jgi:hypothetical protein
MIRLPDVLKNDFGEVDEAMFQVVVNHANPFSASWASKNVSWSKLFK